MEKTTHYNLNLPSGEDYYNIEHQNENMRRLDNALDARVGAGCYTGDGEEERTFFLPRTPRFVLLMLEGSRMQTNNARYGGLAVTGSPAVANGRVYLELVEGGFTVTHLPTAFDASLSSVNTNSEGVVYHYLWG